MDIKYLKKQACEAINKGATELNQLSQAIWSHPELYYEEKYAHELLTDYLEDRGFEVQRSYHLDTAFRATFETAAKPHIAVMCEYDALPEIGHGCGHNLIAEVGVAAGLGIKAALKASGQDLAKLTVLGTPAEEGGGGKVDLIRAGAFDDVDVALMAHPSSFTAIQTNILAMTEVEVTYKGKASHAAGFPWEGINALDATVQAYNNISCLRQQMEPAWRVHGVITKGGTKPNIIPEECQLLYYLRTPKRRSLEELIKKAKACFDAAALATGCTVEYKWDPKPYENMVTNRTIAALYEQNARSLGVEFCTDPDLLSVPTGSTDMGNVSHVVPAIHPHFYMGTTESAHSLPFCKAAGATEAQPYVLDQGKILAMTAIDIMCQPRHLLQIKEDFREDMHREAGDKTKPQ